MVSWGGREANCLEVNFGTLGWETLPPGGGSHSRQSSYGGDPRDADGGARTSYSSILALHGFSKTPTPLPGVLAAEGSAASKSPAASPVSSPVATKTSINNPSAALAGAPAPQAVEVSLYFEYADPVDDPRPPWNVCNLICLNQC